MFAGYVLVLQGAPPVCSFVGHTPHGTCSSAMLAGLKDFLLLLLGSAEACTLLSHTSYLISLLDSISRSAVGASMPYIGLTTYAVAGLAGTWGPEGGLGAHHLKCLAQEQRLQDGVQRALHVVHQQRQPAANARVQRASQAAAARFDHPQAHLGLERTDPSVTCTPQVLLAVPFQRMQCFLQAPPCSCRCLHCRCT
jgi:hypothetical protein